MVLLLCASVQLCQPGFVLPLSWNWNHHAAKRPRSLSSLYPPNAQINQQLRLSRVTASFGASLRQCWNNPYASADQNDRSKSADRQEPLRHSGQVNLSSRRAASSPRLDAKETFWFAAMAEAAAAVFACGLCSVSGIPVLGKGWSLSPALLMRAVSFSVPFAAVFWAVERAPTGIQAATEEDFRSFFGARGIWEVAIFCVCVAFGEEFLFRSWLLAGLETFQLPRYVALLSSSLVFGVLHAYTKVYMVLASLAGLLFGWMFLETGQSILEPLVVHFLYDFCTILFMQRKWITEDDMK